MSDDAPRQAATIPDSEYTLTIEDAALLYEREDRALDDTRREAQYQLQWQDFVHLRTAKQPPAQIREQMSDQEKCYWDDWSAIHHWDEALGREIGKPDASVASVSEALAKWLRDHPTWEAKPPPAT